MPESYIFYSGYRMGSVQGKWGTFREGTMPVAQRVLINFVDFVKLLYHYLDGYFSDRRSEPDRRNCPILSVASFLFAIIVHPYSHIVIESVSQALLNLIDTSRILLLIGPIPADRILME
jgi:hypothetical protein